MTRAEQSRGLRDEANVGPDPRRARELRPMKDLKWTVADGEPDVRGWSVYASTGRELGVVDDLLVDTEAGEVVMLDVDLKRDDRHTLAPLRAAWIDRGTKRVVVDARELGAPDTLPALPRTGALSDDDVSRFNDGYVRAYGTRGWDADREYRLRRGEEELRFGTAHADARPADARPADLPERESPRRLLDPGDTGAALAAGTAAAAAGAEAQLDESRTINRELAGLPREQAAARDTGLPRSDRDLDRAVARDLGYPNTQTRDVEMERAVVDDAERRDAAARAAEARVAASPTGAADRRDFDRARDDRDAGLDAIPDTGAIEPRELDARVRIDEGATVDERTPVGGVRYDTDAYPRHAYGDLEDERRRDGTIADRVVSRRAWADDPARARDAADGRVRYRAYDDVGRPDDARQ
ncbi:MAG: PRC-barrel domain-containing protein [Gemmatirosa sp.]|nr:PRC-barrel domain-containing protein [Gemmatirosa sp.]